MSDQSKNFATTHWSMVLAARDRAAPTFQQALAELCTAYWYPLYAFVRSLGHAAEDAQDLTQAFFTRVLEKDYLQVVDREKGKFRSFLLAAFQHFRSNEYDRARAHKRGGGRKLLSLDFSQAECRYRLEPAHVLTPEKLFERRWALSLLDQVLDRLRNEWTRAGKDQLFDNLKVFLTGEKNKVPYGRLAKELNLSAGAVKVTVYRLRRRYRDILREEIERTLDDPSRLEEEIRDLFLALGK